MKKLISTAITLVLTFIMLSFSLYTTYTWYSNNRAVNVASSAFRVGANTDAATSNVVVYKKSGNSTQKYVQDEATKKLPDIELVEYDTVFVDANVNTSIFFTCEITNLKKDEQDTSKFKDYYFEISCRNTSNGWLYRNALTECLSNVSSIACDCGNKDLCDESLTENEIYQNLTNYLTDDKLVSFVQVIKGDSTELNKNTTLRFYLNDLEDYVFTKEGSSLISCMVYIRIDYNTELINIYRQQHADDMSTENVVVFPNDMGEFVLMS